MDEFLETEAVIHRCSEVEPRIKFVRGQTSAPPPATLSEDQIC
jgi:hypothetical protein